MLIIKVLIKCRHFKNINVLLLPKNDIHATTYFYSFSSPRNKLSPRITFWSNLIIQLSVLILLVFAYFPWCSLVQPSRVVLLTNLKQSSSFRQHPNASQFCERASSWCTLVLLLKIEILGKILHPCCDGQIWWCICNEQLVGDGWASLSPWSYVLLSNSLHRTVALIVGRWKHKP